MQEEIKVAYVCDRQAECEGSPYCGKECQHTLDFRHALYFGPHHFIRLDEHFYAEEIKEANNERSKE